MTGWISLHRSIEEHWLFKDERTFSKFEAWIDLLLMVNHRDKKILLGNDLILVKRGQKITSIRKLCERWKWSNNKVKKFLNLLESDGMLIVKSDTKKTLLTVVNYDIYQNENLEKRRKSDANASQEQQKNDADASRMHTNNNVNKDNNVNNENKDNNTTTGSPEFAKLFQKFESKINPARAISIADYLSQDIERYGYEIVDYAFDETIKRHKTNYGYAQSIMNRCEAENIKTREQAEKRATNNFKPVQQKEMTPAWLNEEPNIAENEIDDSELEKERQKLQEELNNLWEE